MDGFNNIIFGYCYIVQINGYITQVPKPKLNIFHPGAMCA